ncbi:hypothetical protein HDU81_004099, partial [Chytriomyces hyalinus]
NTPTPPANNTPSTSGKKKCVPKTKSAGTPPARVAPTSTPAPAAASPVVYVPIRPVYAAPAPVTTSAAVVVPTTEAAAPTTEAAAPTSDAAAPASDEVVVATTTTAAAQPEPVTTEATTTDAPAPAPQEEVDTPAPAPAPQPEVTTTADVIPSPEPEVEAPAPAPQPVNLIAACANKDMSACYELSKTDNPPSYLQTADVITQCLGLANYAREHYTGKAPLTWDNNLAKFALLSAQLADAQGCSHCHSYSGSGEYNWAQNLYTSKGSCWDSYAGWVTNEASGDTDEENKKAGHFMNVVGTAIDWSAYSTIGCASSNDANKATVCNYI